MEGEHEGTVLGNASIIDLGRRVGGGEGVGRWGAFLWLNNEYSVDFVLTVECQEPCARRVLIMSIYTDAISITKTNETRSTITNKNSENVERNEPITPSLCVLKLPLDTMRKC